MKRRLFNLSAICAVLTSCYRSVFVGAVRPKLVWKKVVIHSWDDEPDLTDYFSSYRSYDIEKSVGKIFTSFTYFDQKKINQIHDQDRDISQLFDHLGMCMLKNDISESDMDLCLMRSIDEKIQKEEIRSRIGNHDVVA